MSMPERYNPECPPDAHKVIRDPETKVLATLCVRVLDSEEKNGIAELVELLSLMAKTPIVLCSDDMKAKLIEQGKKAETTFNFVRVFDDKASLVYEDGAVGSTTEFYDLSQKDANFDTFFDLLAKKCLVCIDLLSMYTLRSVSTVYPWDKLLANQFLGQYKDAKANLTESDLKLLEDVRYGRFDALKVEEKSATAYKFLRLERKLFLQYPTDD